MYDICHTASYILYDRYQHTGLVIFFGARLQGNLHHYLRRTLQGSVLYTATISGYQDAAGYGIKKIVSRCTKNA